MAFIGNRLRQSRNRIRELEQQLVEAQKLESLGLLAGAVAHDFNNVLVAIRGFSELLVRDTTGRNAEHAQEVLNAADSAVLLTRQLLTFSQRERHESAPVEVGQIVRDTSTMFQRLIGPAIIFECDAEPVIAQVDNGRLQQLLLNLVVNARDAMPNGGRLSIVTRPVTVDEQRYALIAVADTGHGIERSVRDRMFEPFFTTKPEGVGTGLGLSTVHGIVRQHGGFITVDSTPGEGTRFDVYLPASDAEPAKRPLLDAERRGAPAGPRPVPAR